MNERERYAIELMLKAKTPVREIAAALGRHVSTIYRERSRGLVEVYGRDLKKEVRYLADTAQMRYQERQSEKGRLLKVGNDMAFIRYFENAVGKERLSPCAALALWEGEQHDTTVSYTTLYSYIHSGVFLNLTDENLPYNVSKRKKKERSKVALKNIWGRSIEARPKEIRSRDSFGHWEMDTVYGGKGTSPACLLVLTERKTRLEEVYFMKNRTAAETVRILDDIEKRVGFEAFRARYHSITTDNGVEFLNFNAVQKSCTVPDAVRTVQYFCHPFCSGERGSNENQNKLIRRWIPKGSDISEYKDDIPRIQDWINNLPRKLFGWRSSNDMVKELGLA